MICAYTYPEFLNVISDGIHFIVDLFAFLVALLSLRLHLTPVGYVSLPLLLQLLDLLLQLSHLCFLKKNKYIFTIQLKKCFTQENTYPRHRDCYKGVSYTVNRKYFTSKIFHAIKFHVKQFSDKQPCTALSLTLRMYFRVFNFHTSQAIRKYFNNEIFMIYGTSQVSHLLLYPLLWKMAAIFCKPREPLPVLSTN